MMDIKNFYDKNEIRYYLRAPFNLDGRTIATNGHILISCPEDQTYDDIENGRQFNIILDNFDGAKFQPIPDVTLPDIKKCKYCKGTKKATISDCYECYGEGVVNAETKYNTYYDLDCQTCDGTGEIIENIGGDDNCMACNATGLSLSDQPVKVGNMSFNAFYLRIIIDEPGIEICLLKDKSMMLFRFGEYFGVLMGMRV